MKKIIVLSLFLGLFSCQKEATVLPYIDDVEGEKQVSKVVTIDGILKFESGEALNSTMNSVINKSAREFLEWESRMGFESFFTKSERIYDNVAAKEYNSIEGIKDEVEKYSRYIQLLGSENGEYTVECQLYNNPFKYIVNDDRLFILNKVAYKVLDAEIVIADIVNIDALKEIHEGNIHDFTDSQDFKIINANRETLKSTHTVGGYDDDVAYRDDNKRKVEVYHLVEDFLVIDDYNGVYLTYVRYYNQATAYKKIIGWWKYNTIFCAELDVDWYYYYNGYHYLDEYDYLPYDGDGDEVKSIRYSHSQLVDLGLYSVQTGFTSYDCWVYTRGTTYLNKATMP